MMTPTYPRLLPDRDKINDWYLDEDVRVDLPDGTVLLIQKGFRFDSHSVPWWARLVFPRYIKTVTGTANDVYAAMIHDYLVATEHWHRFSRRFVDDTYWLFMQQPEYRLSAMRSKWMPRAVYTWSWFKALFIKDYRGEPKPNTVISVQVTHDKMI